MAWSLLEGSLQGVIWAFLGVSFEEGRIITGRMDARTLVQTARELGKTVLLQEKLQNFVDFMIGIDEFREARNLAAHGVWARLLPENVPTVSSLRINIDEHVGEIGSETFSRERLEELSIKIGLARFDLFTFENALTSSPDEWLKSRLKS